MITVTPAGPVLRPEPRLAGGFRWQRPNCRSRAPPRRPKRPLPPDMTPGDSQGRPRAAGPRGLVTWHLCVGNLGQPRAATVAVVTAISGVVCVPAWSSGAADGWDVTRGTHRPAGLRLGLVGSRLVPPRGDHRPRRAISSRHRPGRCSWNFRPQGLVSVWPLMGAGPRESHWPCSCNMSMASASSQRWPNGIKPLRSENSRNTPWAVAAGNGASRPMVAPVRHQATPHQPQTQPGGPMGTPGHIPPICGPRRPRRHAHDARYGRYDRHVAAGCG